MRLDVLILGSWPLPFLLRFCMRDVDEKGEVCAGVCRRHCVAWWNAVGVGREMGVWKVRNAGRKLERFIVVAWRRGRRGVYKWCWVLRDAVLEIREDPGLPRGARGAVDETTGLSCNRGS